ncbi:MAG: ABC transporter ATP-binding protein [Coprobacillus sp.]|nr:ABC transporter ATP-binding protein [Coprobacillus sp.]
MIEIKDITKKYRSLVAVNHVNLTIQDGELFGLLGVNGAGKTTLISMLSTLVQPTSGTASLMGHDLIKEKEEIKKIMSVSPQETAIAPLLTVKENLSFFSEIYEMEDYTYLEEIIHLFHLEEVLNKKAKTLSGGYKRRLSIAISLLSKPKVLFLDEPTLGLDVFARRELWKIILSLKGKITIVLTSHYLEEIEALCDRIAVIHKGNIIFEGKTEVMKEQTQKENIEDAFIALIEGDDPHETL